jgi:hypothetical protein
MARFEQNGIHLYPHELDSCDFPLDTIRILYTILVTPKGRFADGHS